MHVGFFERLLQFAHPTADQRTRTRARCEDKVCDPNLVREIGRSKRLPVLIGQLERGNAPVFRHGAHREPVNLCAPDKEKNRRDDEWNAKQSRFPGEGARWWCGRNCGSCHIFVNTRAARSNGRYTIEVINNKRASALVRARRNRMATTTKRPPSTSSTGT